MSLSLTTRHTSSDKANTVSLVAADEVGAGGEGGVHQPLRFISFLSGDLRTAHAYVTAALRHTSLCFFNVQDTSPHEFTFKISTFTQPRWVSMGPFRQDPSSTLLDQHRGTIEMYRGAVTFSLRPFSYLRVTRRPLVQHPHGISFQEGARGRRV